MNAPLKRPALDPKSVTPVIGSQPPHYPAPYERLLEGRIKWRLGDALGLTSFGVNLVELPPGAVSALRHWHSHEDEFIYVLAGGVTLVTEEGAQILPPGTAAGFPKGLADGHYLRNDGNETAIYLEVGSRHPDDTVVYPDADLKTCRQVVFTNSKGEPLP